MSIPSIFRCKSKCYGSNEYFALGLDDLVGTVNDSLVFYGQYTGHNDRKNQPIYVGDIIENIYGKWECIFIAGGFKFKQNHTIIDYNSLIDNYVVGNIYDN